jgi:hypothetical protein
MLNTDYRAYERFTLVVVSSGDFTSMVAKMGIHMSQNGHSFLKAVFDQKMKMKSKL